MKEYNIACIAGDEIGKEVVLEGIKILKDTAENINPENKFPSLFEPVHGSAPDIAGKGIANQVVQIW